jgi:hypothetical protein
MLEDDAQAHKLRLQQHCAFARGAGEDGAVVGQQRGWKAVFFCGGVEDLDNVGSLDGAEDDAGGEQAGVVVEVVEDFDVGAVGEAPVSGVALPHLVGQRRLEADERGLGTLLRLRG